MKASSIFIALALFSAVACSHCKKEKECCKKEEASHCSKEKKECCTESCKKEMKKEEKTEEKKTEEKKK